ncbi:TIGR04325 family methyltransferase [Sulfurimonas sp. RIFOXYB12_FULL_35_9]|uniref:TIGR04325 family methyltransferase n=1 Tax=Sulfurimonas sp. RIFOXYB12_FULL_35_9 TaxID=1802256 RepID=UPI0008AC1838|nr:TIGR04325 family methyltransferase [Sulfurimonas sp. RIFOXYB12_FULL_35_9]OHE05339.1 MAG: hypothetical protein A2345_06710 [Sulfurimonas sp. RIFOXYB12_FULL_35_9]
MKQLIKSLIPPIIVDTLRKLKFNKYGWHGNYKNWEEAKKASTGYDSDAILQKVRMSLLKVKNGEAVYERDSVLFDKIQYSWTLLSGVLLAASNAKSNLRVLDFGGSLGSTYYQNKKFLDQLDSVSWSVVEQKHFVDAGKKDFEDDRLKFYYDVTECVKEQKPNVLVLSSVLQYIEKPYELMDEILKSDFEFIIIDRTSFSKNKQIKLQIVPSSIYTASYPCWFFEEVEFLKFFVKHNYKVIEKFNASDGRTNEYTFKGFILEKVQC